MSRKKGRSCVQSLNAILASRASRIDMCFSWPVSAPQRSEEASQGEFTAHTQPMIKIRRGASAGQSHAVHRCFGSSGDAAGVAATWSQCKGEPLLKAFSFTINSVLIINTGRFLKKAAILRSHCYTDTEKTKIGSLVKKLNRTSNLRTAKSYLVGYSQKLA